MNLTNDVWLMSHKADRRAIGIYERHYSCRVYADGRKRRQFAPPGETMCLLTPMADALFGWVKNKVERYDKQVGVNCFVFRNESDAVASDLIRAAMDRAWEKWPGERLFTYVDPKRVASEVPGYCFRRAGWKSCGFSKKGLLILEAKPKRGPEMRKGHGDTPLSLSGASAGSPWPTGGLS